MRKSAYPYNHSEPGKTRVSGEIDFVKNGMLHVGAESKSILVNTESELAGLTDCAPGTIAFTAGFADMWQLNTSGNWIPLGGE